MLFWVWRRVRKKRRPKILWIHKAMLLWKSKKLLVNRIKFSVAAAWEISRKKWNLSGYCSQVAKAFCDRLQNSDIRKPRVSSNQENPRFWIDINILFSLNQCHYYTGYYTVLFLLSPLFIHNNADNFIYSRILRSLKNVRYKLDYLSLSVLKFVFNFVNWWLSF